MVTCTLSALFTLLGKVNKLHGISVVFISTIAFRLFLSLFEAVPFSLGNFSYVDSLFEAISGITKTGAVILNNAEAY